MYVLELLPAGIAGIMPGLGLSDLLRRVLDHATAGRTLEAQESFQRLLPFIVYSLQNMELFHHAEKRLLHARGLLTSTTIREARIELGPIESSYVDALITGLLADAT
jgi:2-keto-3-deoxy-L-arabinonate dehydratase